jgi:hypothetical protein
MVCFEHFREQTRNLKYLNLKHNSLYKTKRLIRYQNRSLMRLDVGTVVIFFPLTAGFNLKNSYAAADRQK